MPKHSRTGVHHLASIPAKTTGLTTGLGVRLTRSKRTHILCLLPNEHKSLRTIVSLSDIKLKGKLWIFHAGMWWTPMMCVLWPFPFILESAMRRTKVSTIHELLQHCAKHYSSYITGVTNDLKRKEGPELQLAICTMINSMYYPLPTTYLQNHPPPNPNPNPNPNTDPNLWVEGPGPAWSQQWGGGW